MMADPITRDPRDPRYAASLEAAQQQPPAQTPGVFERIAALAEMLGTVNPARGAAVLGARVPLQPLMREALHHTGANVRPSSGLHPTADVLDESRFRVAKEALMGFLRNLRQMDVEAAQQAGREGFGVEPLTLLPVKPRQPSFPPLGPPPPPVVTPIGATRQSSSRREGFTARGRRLPSEP